MKRLLVYIFLLCTATTAIAMDGVERKEVMLRTGGSNDGVVFLQLPEGWSVQERGHPTVSNNSLVLRPPGISPDDVMPFVLVSFKDTSQISSRMSLDRFIMYHERDPKVVTVDSTVSGISPDKMRFRKSHDVSNAWGLVGYTQPSPNLFVSIGLFTKSEAEFNANIAGFEQMLLSYRMTAAPRMEGDK